jgi:predicted ATPase with chaperone activity
VIETAEGETTPPLRLASLSHARLPLQRARGARYSTRVSSPDRIDLDLTLPAIAWRDLVGGMRPDETSDTVRRRVVTARERQRKCLDARGLRTNAEIPDAAHQIPSPHFAPA